MDMQQNIYSKQKQAADKKDLQKLIMGMNKCLVIRVQTRSVDRTVDPVSKPRTFFNVFKCHGPYNGSPAGYRRILSQKSKAFYPKLCTDEPWKEEHKYRVH